ncbi:MAG TPA: EscU/YscU/HrcU family type III secretion system export apparatus switch protein [Candidatus Limnocylindria bacterium]|jgi:flagellar biosynthetic protein FlhB|nr:EscU/YscU/HrcU family type III secretion system export apparatus switch protein [Candidatus Limnocylindria bacterium]
MSENAGDKTELPTQRRLDEAIKNGQFARSAEVQTVFVLFAALLALQFAGTDMWNRLTRALIMVLSHLHDTPLSANLLQRYTIDGALVFAACVAPVVLATMVGGVLAGCIQSRFQTASEALTIKWERLNPLTGLQRIFSTKSLAPTALSCLKLAGIGTLSYSQVKSVLDDPIFHTTVDIQRIAVFLSHAAYHVFLTIASVIMMLAAIDYGYQFWRTSQDLMMTKEEVKEEMKSTEGNPHVKARMRRRRKPKSPRQMLLDVPKADVVLTNPTHLAIALRYDRKTMKAPQIVAKGSRLNALRIREIAKQHQVPVIENKPLARMMFKYGRVGGEIPPQLFAAVAEILAYVYRTNRYRYYAEQNQS